MSRTVPVLAAYACLLTLINVPADNHYNAGEKSVLQRLRKRNTWLPKAKHHTALLPTLRQDLAASPSAALLLLRSHVGSEDSSVRVHEVQKLCECELLLALIL